MTREATDGGITLTSPPERSAPARRTVRNSAGSSNASRTGVTFVPVATVTDSDRKRRESGPPLTLPEARRQIACGVTHPPRPAGQAAPMQSPDRRASGPRETAHHRDTCDATPDDSTNRQYRTA